MGSPSAVISTGLGSWGSVNEVVTLGYGLAEAAITVDGAPRVREAMGHLPGVREGTVSLPGVREGRSMFPGMTDGRRD